MNGFWLFITYFYLTSHIDGRDVTAEEGFKAEVKSVFRAQMPGITPQKADHYICSSTMLDKSDEVQYIVQFLPNADASRVHHMLIYGCLEPAVPIPWDCHRICKGGPQKIIYAWAKNAPPLDLPKDVGVAIGGNWTGINSIVVQIHYGSKFNGAIRDYSGVSLGLTSLRPKYLAGIYLFANSFNVIPPKMPDFRVNMSCTYNQSSTPMQPFAYRTHAHDLAVVISAYRYRAAGDGWHQIGKGNPQLPQMFWPVKDNNKIMLQYGDQLAAQCVFNSSTRATLTKMGATNDDEMCNFYMYYYMPADEFQLVPGCYDPAGPDIMAGYPLEGGTPLPPDPRFPEHHHASGMGGHHMKSNMKAFGNHGQLNSVSSLSPNSLPFTRDRFLVKEPVSNRTNSDGSFLHSHLHFGLPRRVDDAFNNNNAGLLRKLRRSRRTTYTNSRKKADPYRDNGYSYDGGPVGRYPPPDYERRYQDRMNMQTPVGTKTSLMVATNKDGVTEAKNWPGRIKFGQIGGLSMSRTGDVYVFHRGSRFWTEDSFSDDAIFTYQADGAIMEPTIAIIDSHTNQLVKHYCDSMFYMPHGIFVDHQDNIWVTDVALHQVFKLPPASTGRTVPLMTLGGRDFIPGDEEDEFCQPSGVVVDSRDGSIYVADGYCNSRIVRYNSNGQFVSFFGQRSLNTRDPPLGSFWIPHAISLNEKKDILYVADRENQRIQLFTPTTGEAIAAFRSDAFGDTLYSVKYAADADLLFAINGPNPSGIQTYKLQVFVMDPISGTFKYSFQPATSDFKRPHDLAVSRDAGMVFVGELNPTQVWKFNIVNQVKKMTMAPVGRSNQSVVDVVQKGDKITQNVTKTGQNVESSVTKSTSTEKRGLTGRKVFVIFAAILLPILVGIFICLCLRFRKQGGFKRWNLMMASDGDKKGLGSAVFNGAPWKNGIHRGQEYRRLNTEDIDAIDDISDGSDQEDTLYTSTSNGTTTLQLQT